MKLLWERFGMSRKGLTADEYWDVLAEVAGERLSDLRRDYAYGVEDSWNDLVDAMAFNGLKLEKYIDSKGFVTPKISKL
jgi:predicted metalloprotease with PDZ domain